MLANFEHFSTEAESHQSQLLMMMMIVSLGVHPSLSGSQVLEQRIDEAWEDDEAIMN